jgi:hypothetical protein
MAADCESARSEAITEYKAAATISQRTELSGAQDASAQARMAAARERMRETTQVIGDCDAALELIAAMLERLDYAAACFRQVPADLAAVYDIPMQMVRDGGTLPWSGDFLTGNSPVYLSR